VCYAKVLQAKVLCLYTGALVNDYFSPKIKPISSRVQFTDVAKIYFLIVFDRFENF
jgi:hypothetical protein